MVTVCIIESSFLLRLAMKRVFQSIDSSIVFHELSSTRDFRCDPESALPTVLVVGEASGGAEEIIHEVKQKGCKTLLLTHNSIADTNADGAISVNDDPETIYKKVQQIIHNGPETDPDIIPAKSLSDRETDVLKYVALGFTNKEIADKLFISTHTVITHRKNISSKLGIKTIAGFTAYALINHIIVASETRQTR